ncbi:MAG: phosphatase PAP2 family protein [Cytophagaceae bacterium]|nr:phosphatase PAP2 family protein [Cytophagaceae bacterium]
MKKFLKILFLSGLGLMNQLSAQDLDIELLRKININRYKQFDNELQIINQSADYVAVGVPVVMLSAGFIKNDAALKKEGFNAALSVLGAYGVGYVLKKSINRARPYEDYKDIQNFAVENDASFPSGATSVSFATATSLSLSYPKWYVIVPSYLYAGTVGYSRLHLGVHYPSDVLAGAVLGAGSAVVSRVLNKWVTNNIRKKKVKSN